MSEPARVTYGAAADPAPDGRRLVVLDIDDTLYLERDYVRSGFTAVGGWARDELGVDGLGERAWAVFEAGVRRTIFDEALAGAGVEATPDLVTRLAEVYRSHAPTIEGRRQSVARPPGPARGAGRGDRRAAHQPARQGRGAAAQPVGRPDRIHRDPRAGPWKAAPGRLRAGRARGGTTG